MFVYIRSAAFVTETLSPPPPIQFSLTYTIHTVQLPYKDYFISPSNKTSRKKQQIYVFNTPHSSVLYLKIVIVLGGGYDPPLQV